MGNQSWEDIYSAFEADMVLSESMKIRLKQICIYASLADIDTDRIRNDLKEKGLIPCRDKTGSKKVLSEIYDHVACSF